MKKILPISALLILLQSCATYTISRESFVSQLRRTQAVNRDYNVNSLGLGYTSNGLEKIKCINHNGKEVWLYGSKNVNFKINKKSGGNEVLFFDTAYLKNDTIFGLKSRVTASKTAIPVSSISKITIKADKALTKGVK